MREFYSGFMHELSTYCKVLLDTSRLTVTYTIQECFAGVFYFGGFLVTIVVVVVVVVVIVVVVFFRVHALPD